MGDALGTIVADDSEDELVPEEEQFHDDGSGSAGAIQANDIGDEMKKQTEDIAYYPFIVDDSGSMIRL